LTLRRGDRFAISYLSGTWTVDYRNFPYVGPEGYLPEIDEQIFQGCYFVKQHPASRTKVPYATLLGVIGESGRIFSVKKGGSFRADASGPLWLSMNDSDRCLGDNDGAIVVAVRRTRAAKRR
jgi:hypothetical protein